MQPAHFVILWELLILLPRLLGTGLQVFFGQVLEKPADRLKKFTGVEWLAILGQHSEQICCTHQCNKHSESLEALPLTLDSIETTLA